MPAAPDGTTGSTAFQGGWSWRGATFRSGGASQVTPDKRRPRPSLRLAIPGRLRGIDDIGAGDLRARLFERLALIVRASLLQPVIGGLDDLRPVRRALA